MRALWLLRLLPLLFFIGINSVDGTVISSSFKINSRQRDGRVHYMTKFACAIGECKYTIRARIRHPFALVAWASARIGRPLSSVDYSKLNDATPGRMVIRLVLDDEWEKTHTMAPCDRIDLGRGRTTLYLPLNGTMSNWVANTFRQTYRPHFWYFFAEDCGNSVMERLAQASNASAEDFNDYEVHYELEIHQVDGGHLSFEYIGMFKWNIIQTVLYILLTVWIVMKQKRVLKYQKFQLHIMSQILNAALIGSIWGSILHAVHLWRSDATGSELNVINGIADTCFILAQVAVSSCLILISMGVTLNAPEKFSLKAVGAIGAAIVAAHIAVVFIDKYMSDSRYKHYVSEGPVGWVLILFRCSLWGVFLLCLNSTIRDPRTPAATNRFLRKTLIPASMYFLTFPIMLIVAAFSRSYWRHAIFYHLTFFIQAMSVFLLSELFLNKGEYFKVSTMSQSFLPGGVWRPATTVHHVD